MRRVGFTGTRKGMTPQQKDTLRTLLLPSDEFHHGDCIGADAEAHAIAREVGCSPIVIHPTYLERWRAYCSGDLVMEPQSPLTRNHIIVYLTDLLIAAPATKKEILRSGTWATIRYARKGKKAVVILEP